MIRRDKVIIICHEKKLNSNFFDKKHAMNFKEFLTEGVLRHFLKKKLITSSSGIYVFIFYERQKPPRENKSFGNVVRSTFNFFLYPSRVNTRLITFNQLQLIYSFISFKDFFSRFLLIQTRSNVAKKTPSRAETRGLRNEFDEASIKCHFKLNCRREFIAS